MKLPLFLLVSTVAAASDDTTTKMIRGGGVATQKNTHNFYEAAAQGDFEGIPPLPAYCYDNTNVAPQCNACAVVNGDSQFCGNVGVTNSFVGVCDSNPCGEGYTCEECNMGIADYNCPSDVGIGTYKCVATSVFDSEHVQVTRLVGDWRDGNGDTKKVI